MAAKSEVIIIWKRKGLTMGELIHEFLSQNPDLSALPITYAGRLDPMAEGLVLLLLGDMRFEKDRFLSLPKTYTFECLWGFTTDTFDALGRVLSSSEIEPREEAIEGCKEKVFRMKEQEYPPYSSKPVSGKPLFWWARHGRLSEITLPQKDVELFELDILGSRLVSSSDLENEITESLGLVSGDFRQEEILSLWQKALAKDRKFLITRMRAQVSSGTYIRSLVESMGRCLTTGAVALNIVRTHIGEYERQTQK